MAQSDRDVLFANEAFVIGILQAVSGGGLVAGISQSQSMKALSGTSAYLTFLIAMATALLIAVAAAYLKHQYKMWDVKARSSQARGALHEQQDRSAKAARFLNLMRMSLSVCLVFIFVGIGSLIVSFMSGNLKAETSASTSPQASTPHEASANDNWQRTKDCAEQTDRMLHRNHLEDGQTIGNKDTVVNSENHYSVKYERCFVQVNLITSLQVLRDLQGDVRKSTPTSYWRLFDAFEGKELATCSRNRVENFCLVGGSPGDCSECREFTNDRMAN